MTRTPTFGSLFAGVGGFDLGFEAAGWECKWQVEWDPKCQEVLARHWPHVTRYGDVRNVVANVLSDELRGMGGHAPDALCEGSQIPENVDSDQPRRGVSRVDDVSLAGRPDDERHGGGHIADADGRESASGFLEPVDCITYGFPCQDLSVAGQRAGLDGERSGLFFEAIRIIKEMRDATNGRYPTFAVAENVVGLLSADKGSAMGRCIDALAEIGAVGIEWAVLDAQHFGVPQRRRRVFLVAWFDPRISSTEEILPVAQSGSRYPAASDETPTDPTAGIAYGLGKDHDIAATIGTDVTKHLDGPGAYVAVTATSDSDKVQAVTENQRGELRLTPITNSLTSGGGKPGQGYAAVLIDENEPATFVKARRAANPDDYETWEQDRPAPTLNTFDNASESRATVLISDTLEQPKLFQTKAMLDENWCETSVTSTIRSGRTPEALVMPLDQAVQVDGSPIAATLRGFGHGWQGQHNSTNAVSSEAGVRRLTPRECERLMGWPDDHTRWTGDGKELADTNRYKMCGNGVVANVSYWIARRLGIAMHGDE